MPQPPRPGHGSLFTIDVLEGNWKPKRIVVLEFDNAARAREWYDSEEYRVPKEMRMQASTGNLIVVDGI